MRVGGNTWSCVLLKVSPSGPEKLELIIVKKKMIKTNFLLRFLSYFGVGAININNQHACHDSFISTNMVMPKHHSSFKKKMFECVSVCVCVLHSS